MSEKIIDEVMELVRQLALSGIDYGASDGKQERTDKLKTLNDAEQAIRAKLREVLERKPMTDEQIEEIAKPHLRDVGGHWCNEPAIPDRNSLIEDFARAIEKHHGIGT